MARFRGTLRGNRGAVSRLGHATTGLIMEANGWFHGIKVIASVDENGFDVFEVYETGGSSGSKVPKLIAKVRDDALWTATSL